MQNYLELFVISAMTTPCRPYIKSIDDIVSGMLIESEAKSLQFMATLHLLYMNDGGRIIECPGISCETSSIAAVNEYAIDVSTSAATI